MNWKSYEEITKDIYAVLGKGTGVKIECYGNSCKVTGKSGVDHQVDVLTSHSDGIHCYKTAIECKYWKDRINKDIVMKAEAIKNDCNLDKAVIVSQMGFTPDGLSYAKHVGIDLVELREPLDKDWEGRIKTICIQMHIRMPNLIKFENLISQETRDTTTALQKSISTEDYYYEFKNGETKTVKEYCESFLGDLKEIGKEVEKTITLPENSVLKSTTENIQLNVLGIKMVGVLSETIEKMEIRGENYVQMIMKSAFSGKEFIITKDAEIRESNRHGDK